MSHYADLFDETATKNTVFADKSALNPLTPLDEPVARNRPGSQLATIPQGVREGYLPTTVSIYIDICEWPNHPTDFSQR